MNKHINFEDNIFILNLRIRMIQDLLILDTDTEIFYDKTLDDLDFINTSLDKLLSNLRENFKLIKRDEQFHNLAETERQYCELLGEMENGEGNISVQHYPELRGSIDTNLKASQDRQTAIKDFVAEAKHLTPDPVVGYAELNELLNC